MTVAGSEQLRHEMRNALNVIMGSVQLLETDSELSAFQNSHVQRILRAANKMLSTLESDLPRLGQSKTRI